MIWDITSKTRYIHHRPTRTKTGRFIWCRKKARTIAYTRYNDKLLSCRGIETVVINTPANDEHSVQLEEDATELPFIDPAAQLTLPCFPYILFPFLYTGHEIPNQTRDTLQLCIAETIHRLCCNIAPYHGTTMFLRYSTYIGYCRKWVLNFT